MPANSPPGFDILLTNNWPKSICEPPFVLENEEKNTSLHVSRVAAALKPRYHFAASEDVFYERTPYENILSGLAGMDEVEAKHATRFIGLGDVLNKNKQRWFYAFNLTPMSQLELDILEALPENTTQNPYATLVSNKRKAEEPENYFWGEKRSRDEHKSRRPYICKLCKKEGHHIRQCEMARNQYEKPSLDSCWFCLSNPKIEKHLIVSIGEELYMTLAKGPLLASKDEECKVPGTGHVLIIPVTHYPTFGKVPVESQEAVYAELEKYKSSVRKMFEHYGHGMLTFEISRDSSRGLSHAHTQLVAIPKEKCELVEKTIKEQGEMSGMDFIDEIPDDPEVAYFKMELPNGKVIVHVLDPKRRFNLQFGRMIASFVLDMPQREDWKECKQTEEEEKEEAKLFKSAFKPFDFTL
ncbi:CwfJ C-terminus 1-domain-containing protein-like protein [Sporodiniella umbellata]|nr:CwfJ C-terminus 1-domain-containing protein-like protein [Sporodiniella umbellata]